MIRVAVLGGAAIEAAGLESILAANEALQLVRAERASSSVTEALEELDVDVALLLPSPATRPSPAELPIVPDGAGRAPRVIVLVESPTPELAGRYLRAGAAGVVPHQAGPDEIVAAVFAVSSGLAVIPLDAAGSLGAPIPASRAASLEAETRLAPLSHRETEILGMLAEGLANKNIAARLGISEHTVKTHLASLFAKLGADNRAEAVAIGVRSGLLLL